MSLISNENTNSTQTIQGGCKNIPDIRTLIWKTVLHVVSTVLFMSVIRTYIATPKGVLITVIHCGYGI